jgi:beta-phosphoglucomutase
MSLNIFKHMRNKNIKAILFDMDGTLFDSEVGSIKMMKELALKHHNIKSDTSFEELTGLNYGDKMTKILGFEDKALINIALLEGSKLYSNIAEPIEGVNNCLTKLKAHNLKLAVCTNGDIKLSKPAFNKLNTKLDLYQGTSQSINKKPAPDVYLKALEYFKILPNEAFVIEDSLIGVNAAIAAKIPVENILIFNNKNRNNDFENNFTCWNKISTDDRKNLRT